MAAITPEKYKSLTEREQYYWTPEWKEHTYKKIREYSECNCCGHREFMGWKKVGTPIGEPWRYVEYHPFLPYVAQKAINDSVINSINNTNIITKRIFK